MTKVIFCMAAISQDAASIADYHQRSGLVLDLIIDVLLMIVSLWFTISY